jgi:hypothetical protein
MNVQVARRIAEQLIQSMECLNRAGDIAHAELSGSEKANIMRPIGEIMMMMMDNLYSYLAREDPLLKDVLFPTKPPDERPKISDLISKP